MPLLEPTLLSLARAAGLALLTAALLTLVGPGLTQSRRAARFFFWSALLALLAPAVPGVFLLVEKVQGKVSGDRFPTYDLRMWLRYAPLALFSLWLLPPPVSDAALHCFQKSTASSWLRRLRWRIAALGPGLWLGAALVFLFVFQEFEFATTWNIRSWTVALFDAQAGGLALAETLRLAILPLSIQLLVLTAILIYLRRTESPASIGAPRTSLATTVGTILLVLIATAGTASFFLPLLSNLGGGFNFLVSPDYRTSVLHVAPWREIGNSAGLAFAAAGFVWPLAGWVAARRGWRLLFIVPGLLGPFICGLLLLALARLPGLDALRESVFTPVFGLLLVLLPYAVLIRLGLAQTQDRSALHFARAADARRPLWKLDGWPRLAGFLLLFIFAYDDFVINSLAAPPQFVGVGVRLLNLLHYGYSEALAAMYVTATLAPLAAAGLTILAAHLYARTRAR